jgi:uncharacterized glyoxalase superfamily protein PhnB
MSAAWKPEGYSEVSPYLIVADAQALVDFLKATFDATPLRRVDTANGSVMHAEMRLGDSILMLADGGGNWPAVPAHVHVYVQDVDATFQRALSAGAEIVQEPRQREGDTDKRGGVKDPSGTTWWLGTQVS